ncbi:hypothetical protein CJ030_MR8G028454 [Morella rubra]|uniref:GDSL esterase/lipase n=1 Tax=Morella rubra TaxID=262757 RepID=A0A6A1UVS5_9ROSI|nr:hypothetical protein CJ030_MR8G028454 [Morella rubra]
MAPKVFMFRVLAMTLFILPIVSPANFSFPAVFNFGDSNSDTGGLAAGVAFPVGPPNGQTYFLMPSGRFCDGRLIIDFLMNAMDLPFLNPYLDSVGAPDFWTGCNFATGGSTIRPANAASTSPFSLGIQVAQFVRFKARVHLLTKDKKLSRYLPSEESFKQAVYMFDIGQNDLDGAFYSKSEAEVIAFIPIILTEFETVIKRLYYEGGARKFWIHSTGPLGCLPRIIATFGKDPSKLDQFGCVNSHNHAATQFNMQLHDLCTKFRLNLYELCVSGFTQPLAACCGYGGLPLNFDNRIACGQTKNLNGSVVTATPCNNTVEYVNWDGNHYTEAANEHVSSQILTGDYLDPPQRMISIFWDSSSLNRPEKK